MFNGFLFETSRRVGAGVLGLMFLWQVADRAGRKDGEAVVHVTESNVSIRIDGYPYVAEENIGEPIICPLRPGKHHFTVTRDEHMLYEETFTLESGGQAILTAHDGTRPTRPQKRRSTAERW